MKLIKDLPDSYFVAWDWDHTLSHNYVELNEEYLPLLNMVKDAGLKQVIISGRSPTDPAIPELGIMPIISIHTISNPIYDGFNSVRFKMWVMRLPEIKKHMVCYIDTDPDTIRVLGRRGIKCIPPTMLESFLAHVTRS